MRKPPTEALIFFCEDVRFERGDKLSYMGIIGPDTWVRANQSLDFRCVFMTWVSDPEVTVKVSFEFEGAPKDVHPPAPKVQGLRKNEGDESERWLVQMPSRLKVQVENKPVTVRAKFVLGSKAYTNRIMFDPLLPEAYSETLAEAFRESNEIVDPRSSKPELEGNTG